METAVGLGEWGAFIWLGASIGIGASSGGSGALGVSKSKQLLNVIWNCMISYAFVPADHEYHNYFALYISRLLRSLLSD